MSDEMMPCPQCNSPYGYAMGTDRYACPECSHEWDTNVEEVEAEEDGLVIMDVNGNRLYDGDTVIVIKDLPVKGAPKPVKAGTKVKNIKLRDREHDIDCKIDGFGAMGLKSEFVRKA